MKKLIINILLLIIMISGKSQIWNDTIQFDSTFLYQVKAYDPEGEPLNYFIGYQEVNEAFSIDHLTGAIYINNAYLDYLFSKNHLLIVCVRDKKYKSCATISIKTTNQQIYINEGKFSRIYSKLE